MAGAHLQIHKTEVVTD